MKAELALAMGTLAETPYVRASVELGAVQEFLLTDNVAFILSFLHDQPEIELGVPDFHSLILDEIAEDLELPQSAIAAPRGCAKTTVAKLGAIKRFLTRRSRFLVYISNTHVIAAQAVRDIANFIRRPEVEAIWGVADFLQAEEAKGNYTFRWRGQLYIMRSLGAGQQVRGLNVDNQRPDLAIFDDVERVDEKEGNKLGYTGLSKWYYGTVKKALDPRKPKIVFIGNLIETKTLLADFLTSKYWRHIQLASITADGLPLWPARWSISALKADFIEYALAGQAAVWLAEMMNIPPTTARADQLSLDRIKIILDIEPGSPIIEAACITVDPAISMMSSADEVSICVHVRISGVWYLAERYTQKGLLPYPLADKIIELANKWRVVAVGVESVAYQAALIHICEHQDALMGAATHLFLPINNGKQAKNARILAWQSMLMEGLYGLTVSQLSIVDQLRKFDHTKRDNADDEIDAASFIIYMMDNYNADLERMNMPAASGYLPFSAANFNRHITA